MRKFSLFFAMFLFGAQCSFAHTIHLKDGRTIAADEVWEEHQGYVIDDVTLYGLKKAGMPQGLRNVLASLKNQPLPKDSLVEKIQQKIGAGNFQKYQKSFQTYLSEKVVVSYEKHGNTVKIDKSNVKKIDYAKAKSLPSDLFNEGDIESQNAVRHEKERLQKEIRSIKKTKSNFSVGSTVRGNLREKELEIVAQIQELDRDPLGYFLRRYPWRVSLKNKLSEEKCSEICGRELSSVENPTILDYSTEERGFERCMWSCTGKEKFHF